MQIDYMYFYKKLLKAIESVKPNKLSSIIENMQVTFN